MNEASHKTSYDYIIVGGGIAGVPLACFGIHHTELDWDLLSVPQPHLDNRACYQAAAKALGGGSSINYATWLRGPKIDYDRWAKLVGDDRWSYDQLLGYFEKVENSNGGVIKTDSVTTSHPNRKYPLRDVLRTAWESSTDMHYNPRPNQGDPRGITELVKSWNQGKRQFAHKIYNLDSVDVLTEALTSRILVSDSDKADGNGKKVASGIQLMDGRYFQARKEVIVSCGAYNSPKLLLLSGIGPKEHLQEQDIEQLVNAPEVGRNFHDHPAVALIWKLTQGQYDLPLSAIGSNPAFGLGLPADWIVFGGVDKKLIKDALIKDGHEPSSADVQYLLDDRNCFTETLNVYAPAGAVHADMNVPFDGLHISTPVLGMLPTSRGSITLASADPSAAPRIDPNYYATEVDRAAMRAGVRQALHVFQESAALKDVVEAEIPPDNYPPLTTASSDEEIDARIRRVANTFFHPGGSCAMGKAVDSELRLYGVDGLRVVDASVLPTPVAAHYQYCIYTLAEKAADLIAS